MTTTNELNNICWNDFTVNSGIAGVNRQLIVRNTNNFAGSAATVISSVAGAASADPVYQSVVTGGNTWTFGTDNSDNDNFKISRGGALGVNDALQIHTNGEVNKPLQPAFSAYVNANVNNVTGAGFVYPITYNSTTNLINISASYSTATGLFTAPVDGNYFFYASALLTPLGGAGHNLTDMTITLNKTHGANNYLISNTYTAPLGTGANIGCNVSGFFPLVSGDTVNVIVVANGSAADDATLVGAALTAGVGTVFHGYLVS